jgi:hypothetical protein
LALAALRGGGLFELLEARQTLAQLEGVPGLLQLHLQTPDLHFIEPLHITRALSCGTQMPEGVQV